MMINSKFQERPKVKSELTIKLTSLVSKDNVPIGSLAKTLNIQPPPPGLRTDLKAPPYQAICRQQLDAFLGFSPQEEAQFTVVTTISISLFESIRLPNHAEICILAHWLRMFSQLKILHLQDIKTQESTFSSILVQIPRCNPNIRTIIINSVPHDISSNGIRSPCTTPREAITSLQDVVDDVLEIIFQDLPNSGLISLSMVCRRFQLLAIPIFLERHRILPPYTTLILEPSNFLHYNEFDRDALSGLLVSVFIKTVDQLHCVIPYTDYSYFAAFHLLRLRNFISHLDHCKNITIEFDTHFEPFKYHYTYPRVLSQRWGAVCADLFKAALASGCESLKISGGLPSSPVLPTDDDLTRRILKTLARSTGIDAFRTHESPLFKACNLRNPRSNNAQKRSKPHGGALKTLSLHSRMVFGEFLLPQLNPLLRSQASITDFNFTVVQGFSLAHLAGTLPSLTSFCILGDTLPIGLEDFLRSVPQLRHIQIASGISTSSIKPGLSLPNLETFSVSSSFIPYFLSTDCGLPKLSKITLLLAPARLIPYAPPPNLAEFVSDRLSGYSNAIHLELQLRLKKPPGHFAPPEFDAKAVVKSIYPFWHDHRGLTTFSIHEIDFASGTISNIVKLLDALPCLLHVHVWSDKSLPEEVVPGNPHYELLRTIGNKFPSLSTLELNGKAFSSYAPTARDRPQTDVI
ncbi:hypothetical protein BDN72DRAFT_838640 [Pluteus cervinus]|uniref:Uncharacterized protein n=1 Tax=Pluteus cervinus TaxID=181527 RepID=A0ACD3AY86_9AGAR|nr:hypothetical protein BDN72DRAFT_838640 [Pluteus cervinus]